jgi:hypothetical protein
LEIGREVAHDHPVRFPGIMAKVIDGRLRHHIGPIDFLLYDLINRPRATWRDYLREHPHNDRMLRILHPFDVEFVVRDKLLSSERFAEHGVAQVPILAVVGRDPGHGCRGFFPMVHSVDDIVAAMPDWPDAVFVKPVSGSFGEGALVLTRDGAEWLEGDRRSNARQVAETLLGYRDPKGVLVQPRYANDHRMAGISCGLGLCATRIVTAVTEDGPELVVAIHKMIGKDAIADNFSGGMTGNLVCGVDLDSGRLRTAYGRRGANRFLLTRYSEHPATGARIDGFELPHWQETRALALRAATAFPELPLLGHDIAITDRGPLLLEANSHWRISLPQLARGGMRPVLRELLPRLAVSAHKKAAALAALD